MRDFLSKSKKRKINLKKFIIVLLLCVIFVITTVTIILYKSNSNIKNWIDINILNKEVLQEDAVFIELDNESVQSYAYSQYIGTLSNNNFDIYNSLGNKEETLNIEISNPIFNSNNRFLVVAEKNGQQAYLITNKTIQWETKVEGNISQIHVNKNGYVAIVVTNTSYKTVIEMYNPDGDEMFRTYLSSTRAADVSISNDNKYLALAEVDTSGTVIQSTVKIISIQKSQEDPTNSIESTYKAESNRLITNVKYQDKDKLVCMYTDGISVIDNGTEEFVTQNNNKKITFSSITLDNCCVTLEERNSSLFTADSVLKIIKTDSREETEYVADEIAKNIFTKENIIALNFGTEIEFVNKGGWMIKRYIANQEITNVIISNDIAGIVYRNKIEIVKL